MEKNVVKVEEISAYYCVWNWKIRDSWHSSLFIFGEVNIILNTKVLIKNYLKNEDKMVLKININ